MVRWVGVVLLFVSVIVFGFECAAWAARAQQRGLLVGDGPAEDSFG